MAKRRGGFPGGGNLGGANLNKLMKQAQKMQEEMAKAQEEIAEMKAEGTAGGGMVKVTVDGDHLITDLVIAPEVVDPDDIEMLQDLIISATNDAMKKLSAASAERMNTVTGGMGGLGGGTAGFPGF